MLRAFRSINLTRGHGNYCTRFAYVKSVVANKDGRSVCVYELERAEIDR